MTAGLGLAGSAAASEPRGAAQTGVAAEAAVPARWQYVDTMSSWLRCQDLGAQWGRSGRASDYRCDSDHPFWALFVLR